MPGESTQLEIRDVAPSAAMQELGEKAAAKASQKRRRCFKLIRARTGSLANASVSGEVQTLVDFLESYGVLFTQSGELPSEPIEIELMRDPSPYKLGDQEGVFVLFRQRVGNFLQQDTLVGGRFIGQDLYLVGGCLYDPSTSPAREATPAIANADAARAVFRAHFGPGEVADTARVRGFVWFEKDKAEWVFRGHRVDALTGAYLGLPEPLPADRFDYEGTFMHGGAQ